MTTPYRPDNPFAGNGRYRSDNPFAAEPPPSVMGSVALPTVGKAARDATVAPFRNLDESGAAYDALQRTNIQDAKGVAATALQGATFNLADDVLPIKGSVAYLKRRSPTVAAGVNLASGLAVPGVAALKAIKAIRPTTMAGQVALGAGLGATEAGLATAGDTEGSLGERLAAGAKAAPIGAAGGAVLGTVPGAVVKTGNLLQAIKRKPKEAAAAGRSALRLLRGKNPDLGDAVTLSKMLERDPASPFTGLGQRVDIRELATRAKRMNPAVLDGMPSRDVADLVGAGTTTGPKRLAALAAKPGPDVDEVINLARPAPSVPAPPYAPTQRIIGGPGVSPPEMGQKGFASTITGKGWAGGDDVSHAIHEMYATTGGPDDFSDLLQRSIDLAKARKPGDPLMQALADRMGKGEAPTGLGASLKRALTDESGRIGPLFHGSPHKFDKFDLSKIGTGEGAQAYGHGLYFTETPDIARDYRNKLANRDAKVLLNGKDAVSELGYSILPDDTPNHIRQAIETVASEGDVDRAIAGMEKYLADAPRASNREYLGKQLEWLRNNRANIETPNRGALYTAELPNVDPEDFLLWDKPLSQQSEKVRKAVTTALDPIRNNFPTKDTDTAAEVVRALTRESSAEQTTKTLRKAGIKGIKYLDGSSRSAGDGSYNYVVFDDADINILNREGKAALKMMAGTGAAAGGALTAALAADAVKRKRGGQR